MAGTKEPATGIQFGSTLTPPGGSKLALVGVGVRERKIAFIKVKIYALGFYVDAAALTGAPAIASYKGKSGSALAKDEGFFKALVDVPVEKAVKIVLARDVEGAQFWNALDEALVPRLKSAGSAGQQALTELGNVFKKRPLKEGTTVLLTWSQPSTLQVSVLPPGNSTAPAPDAVIESAALLSSLYDVYLGKDPVSPTARTSIASGFPSLV